MITWVAGDLFASGLPAIAHGVNCRGVMGAGIAVQFRQRWPEMFDSYRQRCAKRGGMIPGDIMPWKHQAGYVFNLATQQDTGPDARPWMITAAVGRMITEAHYDCGVRQVGLPLIGCGIGGLMPSDLRDALHPYANAPVDLIIFALPQAARP
jgi:O-acetyl-ADP-ribose deacetylase (regulator of RNase III)